jgi:[protein-PII] uridylyltransferase
MKNEIERLRRKFSDGRSELFRNLNWTSPSRDLLESHTELIDGLLKEIHEISCRTASNETAPTEHSGLAIVATGGYGRRELNPYSDIDIAFIPSEEEDPWVEAVVHNAFKLVMDVFLSLRDVHVGYSFRPMADATAWDVTTRTSLLDIRHICGERTLSERLESRIHEVLSPLDLMLESDQSGDFNQATIYSVEPNFKEGPGSLRDLHRARWIFKLLLGRGPLEAALKARAIFSEKQICEIRDAADWFWRARTWLHLAAGKLSDVLISNYQDRIARELGDCSAQTWLSRHFVHAENLVRFRETAFRTILEGPLKIDGIRIENGHLFLPDDSSGRGSAVSLFYNSQRYSIPVSLRDLKHLGEVREQSLVQKASDEETWAFYQMLGESRRVSATLRILAEFGILDRFIPGFSETMRFVPPDPAHRYTVGEHALKIVEHLEILRSGKERDGQRFTDLLDQCTHFDILCLAALIHDTGKLLSNQDHSETSAEIAKAVSIKLNLAPEKREILDIIVRQHLLLVRVARLHDLNFSNVIQKVAGLVPSIEALRHLYVFTYVDTCAVSKNNWTSMDFRDLEDLYSRMQDFFARTSTEVAGDLPFEDRIGLIRKKLTALHPSKDEAAVFRHCQSMPASYVLNTPLNEIAFHLQLLEKLDEEKIVLDIYNRPGDDYSELTVCTYDDPMPGMLAKITGVLYGCNVDIQKAKAFTMGKERPVILDTLWIRANGMQVSEQKARRIRVSLKEVLTGAKPIELYLAQAGKNPPDGIPLDKIDLRNDLSEEHTVVHIIAHDLQGLLYIMTRSLSRCGLHIHSAKVATFHARAENNFYVTAAGAGQIPDSALSEWTERLRYFLLGETRNPGAGGS